MPDRRGAARLLLVTVTALVTAFGVQGTAVAAPQSGATPTPTPTPVASPRPTPSPSATSQPTPTTSVTPSAPSTPAATNEVAAAGAAPVLSVQVTGAPATIARAGQTVTYTVTVKNTGNGALRDLTVSAVAESLPTLTCAPVAQGATLYTSTTTTCSAKRTSTATDLRAGGNTVSATAAGFASDGTAVTGTASVRTTVKSIAPKVTNDTITVLANTGPVVLPGSTNDSPGEPGGPAIDASLTNLVAPYPNLPGYKSQPGYYGNWEVLASGALRYVRKTGLADEPITAAWTDPVRYETFDTAGQGTVATATVVGRRPPIATQDNLTIGRGQTVTVDPLANDKPGQQLDGSDATFDRASLRFVAVQPGPGAVSPSGDSVTLPNQGVFTVTGGRVRFVPDARSAQPVSVQYSVTDTSGLTATGTVRVAVNAPAPVVTRDVAVTTALTPVTLPAALNDSPAVAGHVVSFAGFVGRDSSSLGSTLSTPQGSWSVAPDGADPNHGPVIFSPAWGFSGQVVQPYLARDDTAGGETVSALTVTVQPGPTARPDTLATRVGTDGTTTPGGNDTPGLRANGSASTFDARWAVFPTAGQPSGGVVTDDGKTLTLPGRGVLWFSNGTVVFRPAPGFHGFAGTVAYQVEDTSRPSPQRGIAVVSQISVLVTSDALTATDDSATTSLNRPVDLPAATNDDPGVTTTSLRPVFPTAGQPAGSVRSTDGLTLTVPGQGVWAASPTAGTVTFRPAVKYVGTTAPVTYRISGAGGTTATARLQVTVAPGAAAVPDSVTRPEDNTSVDPLLNDFPGRSANGRLGTFELGSLRFPTDAQVAGAVVTDSGRTLTIPARGSLPGFTATAGTQDGLIHVVPGANFHGTTPAITYGVLSDVTDGSGTVVRQYAQATLRVTFTGGSIVATDDHVTVRSGAYAHLPAAVNDSPAPGDFPLDLGSVYYAATGQPAGSYLRDDTHGHDVSFSLVVPGEGVWSVPGYGQMLFLPDAGFAGTTSPVRYTVHDVAGIHVGTAAETVTVGAPAIPRADTGTTAQGATLVVHTLANDTPELTPDGHPYGDFDLVAFDPDRRPAGSTLTKTYDNTQLVVPHQGTYTIDFGTGDVAFVPDPTFSGSASAFYLSVPGGRSRFQVTVQPVTPVARNDSASTTAGTPVRVRVLDNDAAGSPARPLVPGSVRLSATGLPSGATLSADRQTLTVPGRGVFATAGDGTVTFRPLSGVTGTVPTVGYDVADVNGTRVSASVTVRVA